MHIMYSCVSSQLHDFAPNGINDNQKTVKQAFDSDPHRLCPDTERQQRTNQKEIRAASATVQSQNIN